MKLQLQVQAKKEELLYKVILQNRCFEFSGGNLNIETPTLSHPLKHAITTKFCVSSRHHAINLVQFTITPINLGLGGDYMIPVSRDEILSLFAGIPAVL